jgi:hypothetical protein
MANNHAHPVDAAVLDGTIDDAAAALADSVTRALHDRPSTMLVCVIVWALSAPVHFLLNAI